MSSHRIHQMQVFFSPEEDRLQLRINTQSRTEFRFWLTRRFIKRFWPGLQRALEVDTAHAAPSAMEPATKSAMMNFMHQHAVSQTDFSTQFQENPNETPLGNEPLLVTRARLEPRGQGSFMVSLHPQESHGIEVAMDATLLHSFCKLLSDAVGKADWNLSLLPTSEQQPTSMGGSYTPAGSGYKLN